jgi:dipeptide transport system ATP-binding protein
MSIPHLLEGRELTQTYRLKQGLFRKAQVVAAASAVSLTLDAGETLAIVGESGSGKSTIARMIAMLEKPASGKLLIDGVGVDEGSPEARRARRLSVQMVFQNPYGSLNPRKTVGRILAEPLVLQKIGNARSRGAAVAEMLEKVGLRPEQADRYPHMFSGGQRQRIAIGRALMLRPRIVVADEAVSALDASIQAQILNLLLDLQDEFKLAYLFISHDLAVVKHVADRVIVMYFGRPVEVAGADQLFGRPAHPYTQLLLSSSKSILGADPDAASQIASEGELPSAFDPPAGCAFAGRCPLADDMCRAQPPELRPLNGGLVACHKAR